MTLGRVEAVLRPHCVARTVFDRAGFGELLRRGLGLQNPLLIGALYATFDTNQDGNLSHGPLSH